MGRAPCCEKNGLKKGPWTPEEDQKLIDYITKHGHGNWRTLPMNAGLQRCGKSCRLRWTNYLKPDIKRGRFSLEEEETIIQLHSMLGNKWSTIAAHLPGRTDNEIKNYWNTHIRKRFLRMGIDPVTHSPALDLLDLSTILSSCLHDSSQINVPGFVGGVQQPLINQELLRLATSPMATDREFNNIIGLQNGQENQLCSDKVQNHQGHYQQLVYASQFRSPQEMSNCAALTSSPFVPFSSECESRPIDNTTDAKQQYSSYHISNFSSQNSQPGHDNWQSNGMASCLTEDWVPLPSYYNNFYGYDPSTVMDPQSETSTLVSHNSNHSFSFAASILSTPSSSSTPLNSNSTTYLNGSSCKNAEDEIESYCSNLLKLEISDILDVSNFM